MISSITENRISKLTFVFSGNNTTAQPSSIMRIPCFHYPPLAVELHSFLIFGPFQGRWQILISSISFFFFSHILKSTGRVFLAGWPVCTKNIYFIDPNWPSWFLIMAESVVLSSRDPGSTETMMEELAPSPGAMYFPEGLSVSYSVSGVC